MLSEGWIEELRLQVEESDEVVFDPTVQVKQGRPAPSKQTLPADKMEDARLLMKKITIYEDDKIVILNKPFGLASQGGTKQNISVDEMLVAIQEDGKDKPRLVHRLDKDCSGALIIAKTRTCAQDLMRIFGTFGPLTIGLVPKHECLGCHS
jgi:23S rRNA pseudouridine955/2504/2580 synthase